MSVRDSVKPPNRIFLRVLCVVVMLCAGALAPAASSPKPPKAKFDKAVSALTGDASEVRVIVTAAKGRKADVARTLARKRHQVIAEHASIDALTVQVAGTALEELASDPAVARVSIDAKVKSYLVDEVGTLDANMLLPTLALPYQGFTGAGVGVAVVDTGIVNHSEIPVAAFYDLIKEEKLAKPFDLYGHGTHVAGMIMDKQDKSDARYRSIAKGVRLIGLRALDDQGFGYTSTVIHAIEFAIANKTRLGIDVLNLSLGHPIYESAATDPLVQAVERAVAAGIVVVVSAGNEGMNRATGQVGYAGITSPGNAPSAITVGAVDTGNTITRLDDQVADFSSRGPTWYDAYAKPDLVAPGRRIVSFMAKKSALYNAYPGYRVDVATRTYMKLSGTSMSAAVTSGVVALMIEASRASNSARVALPPNAIKAILQHTAIPIAGVDELTQGAGSLNAAGAVALARAIDPTRPQGTWWLTSSISPLTQLPNGERAPWGQRVIWGERLLTGDSIYVNEPAWTTAVIWGNAVVWGNAVIWGNAVVWGNAVIWGNAVVWGNTVIGYHTDGTAIYGDAVDWSSVNPDAVIWGNISDVIDLSPDQSQNSFTPVF